MGAGTVAPSAVGWSEHLMYRWNPWRRLARSRPRPITKLAPPRRVGKLLAGVRHCRDALRFLWEDNLARVRWDLLDLLFGGGPPRRRRAFRFDFEALEPRLVPTY